MEGSVSQTPAGCSDLTQTWQMAVVSCWLIANPTASLHSSNLSMETVSPWSRLALCFILFGKITSSFPCSLWEVRVWNGEEERGRGAVFRLRGKRGDPLWPAPSVCAQRGRGSRGASVGRLIDVESQTCRSALTDNAGHKMD